MHFLKSDFIEHLYFETRLKLKRPTATHLHVKASGQLLVPRERGPCCFIHCSKHLPDSIYFRTKILGAYFQHSLRELTAKRFHLHPKYEALGPGKGRGQENLHSSEGECFWL